MAAHAFVRRFKPRVTVYGPKRCEGGLPDVPRCAMLIPMPTYANASELLAPGQAALCLFTDGRFLYMDGGAASSGFWFLREPQRPYQLIIVYRWTYRVDGGRHVDLFVASPGGHEGPVVNGEARGRYNVRLIEPHLAGTTVASSTMAQSDAVSRRCRQDAGLDASAFYGARNQPGRND